MSQGGIANRLIDLAESIVGRFSGGLGIVVVLATAVFGAISGMASSAVAAIGTTMIPRMVENGYDRGYATSSGSSRSVLVLLLPPSASIILYGWCLALLLRWRFLRRSYRLSCSSRCSCFWNWVLTRRMPLQQIPALPAREWGQEVARRGRRASLGLFMPLIILGCIYGGNYANRGGRCGGYLCHAFECADLSRYGLGRIYTQPFGRLGR